MPWRDDPTAYHVTLSELMLQQTQVSRVMEKYPVFLARFPDFSSLARAKTADVLCAWQGLGYNRRALFLKRLAEEVCRTYGGTLPTDERALLALPGIGKGTAGSIAAFAFNQPVAFIETNIRRVFIHHFFTDRTKVDDREILLLVRKAIDQKNPREWYYALMDYGAYLSKKVPNPNKKSSHYVRQSAFKGSDREIRGAVLRTLIACPTIRASECAQILSVDLRRLEKVLGELRAEGFIVKNKLAYRLA